MKKNLIILNVIKFASMNIFIISTIYAFCEEEREEQIGRGRERRSWATEKGGPGFAAGGWRCGGWRTQHPGGRAGWWQPQKVMLWFGKNRGVREREGLCENREIWGVVGVVFSGDNSTGLSKWFEGINMAIYNHDWAPICAQLNWWNWMEIKWVIGSFGLSKGFYLKISLIVQEQFILELEIHGLVFFCVWRKPRWRRNSYCFHFYFYFYFFFLFFSFLFLFFFSFLLLLPLFCVPINLLFILFSYFN